MRIFVTGATGVTGRRAVPLLIAAGHEVTAVARSPEKAAALERAGARAAQVDLFDAATMRRAVEGHDTVVNLATAVPPSSRALLPGAWKEMDRIRRDASAILVDAALAGGVGRFVQESFAPIYADNGDGWIDEGWTMRPARYNRSTLDAEASAERFTRGGGTGVVLRFGWFYGPDAGGATLDMIGFVRKGWSPAPGARRKQRCVRRTRRFRSCRRFPGAERLQLRASMGRHCASWIPRSKSRRRPGTAM